MNVAHTSTGGEIEVAFPPGAPYPQGVGSVTVREVADHDRSIFDHLERPIGIPVRQGQTVVTSHLIAGRSQQYLLVWRHENTGEHSITLFDASNPQQPMPTIARSRARILGVAQPPSILAADHYVVAWTLTEGSGDEGQVMVEAHTWRPSDS